MTDPIWFGNTIIARRVVFVLLGLGIAAIMFIVITVISAIDDAICRALRKRKSK